jgi:hypothetical protein
MDDYLHVRNIRQGVEFNMPERPNSRGNQE